MARRSKLALISLLLVTAMVVAGLFMANLDIAVLSPKGTIASQQKDLLVFATLLSMVIIVPVFVLTFFIAWKYRASNTKAKYTPEWDHHKMLELIWWGIPLIIIVVLSVITWRSSHQLDPYRPLESEKKPLTVQVVALQWKWLFIYPEQGIATVNYVQIPEDTPVNFEITADAPMNSFWIPQLGGQVYAMNGMVTKLHLMADEPGDYAGSSANISGEGFAGMTFTAKASTPIEFENWVMSAQRSSSQLDLAAYDALAQPSKDNPEATYVLAELGLHHTIMMKYMAPGEEQQPEGHQQNNSEDSHHGH